MNHMEEIVWQLIDILKTAAGKLLELPDDATQEEIVSVLKEFAKRVLSVDKKGRQ